MKPVGEPIKFKLKLQDTSVQSMHSKQDQQGKSTNQPCRNDALENKTFQEKLNKQFKFKLPNQVNFIEKYGSPINNIKIA